jgi:hypothetical protein
MPSAKTGVNRLRKVSQQTRSPLIVLAVAARIVVATACAIGVSTLLCAAASEQSASQSIAGRRPPEIPCHVRGSHEISITCDYVRTDSKFEATGKPRVALNHAAFVFKTKHDNWMSVALTFTNLDSAKPSEARSVYLAIDDDSGKNYIRRVLPHVDFRNLMPGQKTAFSEHLLIPALHPGHYRIELWIPSSDPALKFDVSHNFLLESVGVADRKTGLNRVASFSVVH